MPSDAFMQGSVRTYNNETRVKVLERIRVIAEQTAIAHDCTAEVELITLYPATVNHKEQVEYV